MGFKMGNQEEGLQDYIHTPQGRQRVRGSENRRGGRGGGGTLLTGTLSIMKIPRCGLVSVISRPEALQILLLSHRNIRMSTASKECWG